MNRRKSRFLSFVSFFAVISILYSYVLSSSWVPTHCFCATSFCHYQAFVRNEWYTDYIDNEYSHKYRSKWVMLYVLWSSYIRLLLNFNGFILYAFFFLWQKLLDSLLTNHTSKDDPLVCSLIYTVFIFSLQYPQSKCLVDMLFSSNNSKDDISRSF